MNQVHVPCDLDAKSLPSYLSLFEELGAQNSDVTLDFGGVTHLDGCGMGALLYVFKRKREKGFNFMIVNASGQPRKVLVKLGLFNIEKKNLKEIFWFSFIRHFAGQSSRM